MARTVTTLPANLSWKAVLAFLFPALGTLMLAAVDQVLSMSIDPTLKIAIVGAANALLALAGAYLGSPGQVVHPDLESADIHDAPGA
jgi:hypothetical protein